MDASSGAAASPAPVLKPPKPPDKPLVPYMRFSRKMWHKVRQENPESQLWDIGRKIGSIWREMSDSEKREYQEEYETEKVEYDRNMKVYHNSAAYQAYLANKNRAKMLEQQQHQQQQVQQVAPAQQQPLPPTRESHSRPHQPIRVESGVFIQAVDEDDGESQVSIRRVAATRYERNHRLISDLFSDSTVQDTRSITTQNRLSMLKRQAASLSTHQKNLENELEQLEEKFQNKKRQIEESSQKFSDTLKKVCDEKPVIDEKKYQGMVQQAREKLLRAYEVYKQRHDAAVKKAAETQAQAPTAPAATASAESIPMNQQQTEFDSRKEKCAERLLVNGAAGHTRHEPITEKISSTISDDSKDEPDRDRNVDDGDDEMSESENQLLYEDEEDD